jgi:hypothetical protein
MSPEDIAGDIQEYTGESGGLAIDVTIVAQGIISDITSLILGIASGLILLGIGLITALDICYITMPAFQSKIAGTKWDGSVGRSRVRIISNDARLAVLASIRGEGNGHALTIYLRKRPKTIIICGAVLAIIVTGPGTIIRIVAKVVYAVMAAIGLT